jgi:hypothetical protein
MPSSTSRPLDLSSPLALSRQVSSQNRPIIDSKKALEVLGITLTPWKKTVDDGLDALLKVEKDWTEKGVDLTPLKNNEWVPFGESGANSR